MVPVLQGRTIAFLVANEGIEQVELVEADVVRDRTLTSWPSLRTDLRNAGASWVDEPVIVCSAGPNVLITSRKPDDLPAFCDEAIKTFAAS